MREMLNESDWGDGFRVYAPECRDERVPFQFSILEIEEFPDGLPKWLMMWGNIWKIKISSD